MRIVGGEARGRRLYAPEGNDTRPTSEKVRESLFNIIRMRVDEARVLDLFAGSGALSLEALSRGAASAVLVDASRKAGQVIAKNIALTGMGDRCRLIVSDWRRALDALAGERFSLVFLDPPYRMTEVYGQAAECLIARDMLAEDALLALEYARGAQIELPEAMEIYDERRYGDTCLALARRKPVEDDGVHLSGQL